MSLTPFQWVVVLAMAHQRAAGPPDVPECSGIWSRPSLRMEHEACAHAEADGDTAASTARISEESGKHTFAITFEHIPDATLRSRVKRILGGNLKGKTIVLIMRDPPADHWLRKKGVSRQVQAGGGGATVIDRLILACTAGGGVAGHYDLSLTAWRKTQWHSRPGERFLAEASKAPDAFLWETPAAHAQTPNKPDSPEPTDAAAAREEFKKYIADRAGEVVNHCRKSPSAHVDAAYALGYLLHAVQDLSTHAGRTNAEHSFAAYEDKNPDGNTVLITRAQDWSNKVMSLLEGRLADCLQRMAAIDGSIGIKQLGRDRWERGPDGTLSALWEYRQLGSRYAKRFRKDRGNRPDQQKLFVRWFDDASASTFFDSHVVGPVLSVLPPAPP